MINLIIITIIISTIIGIGIQKILENPEKPNLKYNNYYNYNNYNNKTYKIKNVFTNSEIEFYKELKDYLKNKDVILLSKIRLADFVGFNQMLYGKEFAYKFGAISQKHIDFLIANTQGKVLALIELDGYTHNYDKTKKNDEFKDELFKSLNIPLLRFKTNNYNSYNFNILNEIIKY